MADMTYDLEKIEEVCRAATPGPWKLLITDKQYLEKEYASQRICIDDEIEIFKVYSPDNRNKVARDNNAEFIINARTALPELCARVRELEGELKRELISHERDERISDNWLNQACILQGKLNEAQAENAALRKVAAAAQCVYIKHCKPCIENKCNACSMCPFGAIKAILEATNAQAGD